jgi:phage terminase Nu1 subunit (DNA packaging protein)
MPSLTALALALATSLAILLTSIVEIRSRRLQADFRQEIDRLREEIRQMQIAADRQFVRSLNPQPDAHKDSPKRDIILDG